MKTIPSETDKSRESNTRCENSTWWMLFGRNMNRAVRCAFWVIATLLVALFTLGYFLNPSVLRIVWLVISGTLLVIALPLITFRKRWMRQCEEDCEKENQQV